MGWTKDYIGGVMASVLASRAVDPGLDQRLYNIGICCFSTEHISLRRKGKDWLARNQNTQKKSHVYPRIVVSTKLVCSTKGTSSSYH